MDLIAKYQRKLLEQSQYEYYETPISEATQQAFLETPRHVFVKRYRHWGTKDWQEVSEENLEEHLAILYGNNALPLFGDDDNDVPSTISQPSFVLRMLDMVQFQPGQRVFELGAGSGWNAALMGWLVGSAGAVYSVEIIPEVAQMALETIEHLEIKNVHILQGDGGDGHLAAAPYDRAIFTAGSYDLPGCFHEQIKVGGLLLIVIKNEGGGDTLFLLRKNADHFEALEAMPCAFVQVTGKSKIDSLEPIAVETLPEWIELEQQALSKTLFWWGGKGRDSFIWRTLGFRSFLGITEPSFRAFKVEKSEARPREEHYFGLWDQAQRSLVLAKEEGLIAYGSPFAKERLLEKIRLWVDLGMPSASNFSLRVYPSDVPLIVGEHQWIVTRQESKFLWSLEL